MYNVPPAKSSVTEDEPAKSRSPIYSIAINPYGNRLAVGLGEGKICIRNPKKEKTIGSLKEHKLLVSALCYSNDGTMMASGSNDRTIKLWNTQKNKCQATLANAHKTTITSLVISSDNMLLASGDTSGEIKLWYLNTSVMESKVVDNMERPIWSMRFSPDGDNLIAGCVKPMHYGKVVLYDIIKDKVLHTMDKVSNHVLVLGISIGGRCIIVGTMDNISVWDFVDEKEVGSCEEENVTSAIAFGDETFVTGNMTGEMKIWDKNTLEMMSSFRSFDNEITGVAVNKDSNILAAGYKNGNVSVYSAPEKA